MMTFSEAHRAIKRGDVLQLGDVIPEALDPNVRNRFGWSLLMLAALEGNTAIGRLLIRSGADLDARNQFDNTPLSLAAHKGHMKFLKLLIEAGATDVGRPHGHSTEDWLRIAAGLPLSKLAQIADIFRTLRTKPNKSMESDG